MHRKYLLALTLCLAVAALTLGAGPALAQDGCDCHTDQPPTATAAHAPFVTGAFCTTCHVAWTVPHPESVQPTLTLSLSRAKWIPYWSLSGGLSIPWVPLPGATVYVQRKPIDATAWSNFGELVTDERAMYGMGAVGNPGTYNHRSISQGLAGPPVIKPALSVDPVPLPTPALTLSMPGRVSSGESIRARGTVTPTALAGQQVLVRLWHRRHWYTSLYGKVHWTWDIKRESMATIGTDGRFSMKYTLRHRGVYMVRAVIVETSAYQRARSEYQQFRVR